MGKIVKQVNDAGQIEYPVTLDKAVVCDNRRGFEFIGKTTLDDRLINIENNVVSVFHTDQMINFMYFYYNSNMSIGTTILKVIEEESKVCIKTIIFQTIFGSVFIDGFGTNRNGFYQLTMSDEIMSDFDFNITWGEYIDFINETINECNLNPSLYSYFRNLGVDIVSLSDIGYIRDNLYSPLRQLYVSAGALYNDTFEDIMRTDDYGESIAHKPGCYYLNGLGDITEEEMAKIYNDTHSVDGGFDIKSKFEDITCRTTFRFLKKLYYWNDNDAYCLFYEARRIETINFYTLTTYESHIAKISNLDGAFVNCCSLRKIFGVIVLVDNCYVGIQTFQNCNKLEEIRIHNLMDNVSFTNSPNLSAASIQYMIENAAPTSNITITLHATAYIRVGRSLASWIGTKPITIAHT